MKYSDTDLKVMLNRFNNCTSHEIYYETDSIKDEYSMRYFKVESIPIKFEDLKTLLHRFIWIVDYKNGYSFMTIISIRDDCGMIVDTEDGLKYMKLSSYGKDWIAYRVVPYIAERL